jgi:hypothetical protein
LASLLAPSSSARRDSSVLSELDLQIKIGDLETSLQSSTPKQILQSLTFLTQLSSKSVKKQCAIPPKPSERTETEMEEALVSINRALLAQSEKYVNLRASLAIFPRREYATTEAKCRALRTARAEAMDKLDEVISDGSHCGNPEWNEDVKTAEGIKVSSNLELQIENRNNGWRG